MLMGRTEAFRARNSGLALGWVWMQQNGLLGEQTAKMWRTARDELTWDASARAHLELYREIS